MWDFFWPVLADMKSFTDLICRSQLELVGAVVLLLVFMGRDRSTLLIPFDESGPSCAPSFQGAMVRQLVMPVLHCILGFFYNTQLLMIEDLSTTEQMRYNKSTILQYEGTYLQSRDQ